MATDTPAPAEFGAWFDVHMRGQIVSDLYVDDLRCAFAAGRAAQREADAQLAEQHEATCQERGTCHCKPGGHRYTIGGPKPFADLLRQDTPESAVTPS